MCQFRPFCACLNYYQTYQLNQDSRQKNENIIVLSSDLIVVTFCFCGVIIK